MTTEEEIKLKIEGILIQYYSGKLGRKAAVEKLMALFLEIR